MKKNIKPKIETGGVIAFVLALSPILDPYALLEAGGNTLRLMDIPVLIIPAWIILKESKVVIPNNGLIKILSVFCILTLITFLSGFQGRSFNGALKVLAIWATYTFCISYLWRNNRYEKFIKYAANIAFISTILLIMQFIAVSLGHHNFYDGRLPFLSIGQSEAWFGLVDTNTGDTRVHSFFQEPSYYGLYCLPVFAQAFKEMRFKLCIFLYIGLVICSSLIAIIGGILIIVYLLFCERNNKKINLIFWSKILIFVSFVVTLLIVLYYANSGMQNVIDYYINRFCSLSTELQGDRFGSAKLRLFGYSYYFEEYPIFLKLFGAGTEQYAFYLQQYNVLPYSSTMVTVLLNYGIIGIAFFIAWLLKLMYTIDQSRKCFVMIFVIYCLVDRFWFNWYFFYTLAWFLSNYNKFPIMSNVSPHIKISKNKFFQGAA